MHRSILYITYQANSKPSKWAHLCLLNFTSKTKMTNIWGSRKNQIKFIWLNTKLMESIQIYLLVFNLNSCNSRKHKNYSNRRKLINSISLPGSCIYQGSLSIVVSVWFEMNPWIRHRVCVYMWAPDIGCSLAPRIYRSKIPYKVITYFSSFYTKLFCPKINIIFLNIITWFIYILFNKCDGNFFFLKIKRYHT